MPPFKILLLTTALTLVGLSATCLADDPDTADSTTLPKLIQIRPNDSGSDTSSNALHVSLKPSKSHYDVQEAIHFKVKGDKDFYLYLFNIDPRTGKGIAILPNRIQSGKKNHYRGDGKWYEVPNQSLNFYSDSPGVERIVMVASQRYLDAGKLINPAKAKSVGDFFVMDDPLKGLQEGMSDAYPEEFGQVKLVHVRRSGEGESEPGSRRPILSSSNPAPSGIVIQEIDLSID